jgi:hypothetical protein
VLLLVAACSGDGKPREAVPPARACGSDSVLTGTGVGELRVGSTVEQLREQCDVVLDTTLQFGNEGQPERRLGVKIGVDTVHATIEAGRVWRIEVRSPRFRTSDSIGVGSTVRELSKQAVKFLGYGEGGPFVSLPTHCGLSFELDGVPGVARTLGELPPSAAVERILVVGCQQR